MIVRYHQKQRSISMFPNSSRNPSDVKSKGFSQSMPSFLQNLPGMMYKTNEHHLWGVQNLSGRCFSLLGFHSEEILTKKIDFFDLIFGSDKGYILESIRTSIKRKEKYGLKMKGILFLMSPEHFNI